MRLPRINIYQGATTCDRIVDTRLQTLETLGGRCDPRCGHCRSEDRRAAGVRRFAYPSKAGIYRRNRRPKAALPANALPDHRPTKCVLL